MPHATLAPSTATPTRSVAADHHLIAQVRAGDDAAFAALYERYRRRIAAYIYGMVKDYARAEDIAQDVFMSALRRMRETDREIVFKPWIYEIAKNACIDQFRRARRAEEVSYDADGAVDQLRLVSDGPTPDAAVSQKLDLDNLRGAFGGLSKAHHEILVMREFEGLSYREIGARLGMSRPSVESTLFRARRRLAEEYEELISGARCVRVQGIIERAETARLGTRDRRKLAAHVSHCQPCRRHAIRAGIDPALLRAQPRVRTKVAALLPLPAFLRRRFADADPAAVVSQHSASAAQWSAHVSSFADPAVAGWARAIAAAVAVAVAGVGAGVATNDGQKQPARDGAAAQAPAVVHQVEATATRVDRGGRAARPGAVPAASRAPSVAAPSRSSSRRSATTAQQSARRRLIAPAAPAPPAKGLTDTPGGILKPAASVPEVPTAPVASRPVRRTVKRTVARVVQGGRRTAPPALSPAVEKGATAVRDAGAQADELLGPR